MTSALHNAIEPTKRYIQGILGSSWFVYLTDRDDTDSKYVSLSATRDGIIAFHIMVLFDGTGTLKDGKVLCAQEVMDKSSENDGELTFAVYNAQTQRVYFCTLDPNNGELNDKGDYLVATASARLKEFADANYAILKPTYGPWIWSVTHNRNYRIATYTTGRRAYVWQQ